MDEHAWLAERFEEHRTRLRTVAYRMLGSLAEADEAVQDAWLRVSRLGAGEIDVGGSSGIISLRASVNRLATFHTWQVSERSNKPSIVSCYIRYSPIDGASKPSLVPIARSHLARARHET
jgi:hypothetical protein